MAAPTRHCCLSHIANYKDHLISYLPTPQTSVTVHFAYVHTQVSGTKGKGLQWFPRTRSVTDLSCPLKYNCAMTKKPLRQETAKVLTNIHMQQTTTQTANSQAQRLGTQPTKISYQELNTKITFAITDTCGSAMTEHKNLLMSSRCSRRPTVSGSHQSSDKL